MDLFIPPIGTVLVLTSDWVFNLNAERRNKTLFESLGYVSSSWYRVGLTKERDTKFSDVCVPVLIGSHVQLTLPAGMELKIDRIYIRKGSPEFNSVTFRMMKSKTLPKSCRFWAKMADVNKIKCEVQS